MQDVRPIPKILSVLLFGGMVFLLFAAAVLALMTLIMAVPNGLQDQIFASFDSSKPELLPHHLALVCFSGAIVAVAWFFVLKTLRKVVRTVIAGDPFVPENISRLRRIWLIIAGAEIFRMAVIFIAGMQGTNDADINVRIGTWFMVFVIATLAEAFRYGAELRRDQELTI